MPDAAGYSSIEVLRVDGSNLMAIGAVVGPGGPIGIVSWKTSDGVHWTRRDMPETYDIPYFGQPLEIDGIWVRLDDVGVEDSTDKQHWTSVWQVPGPNALLYAMASTTAGLVAVGADYRSGGELAIVVNSADGVTWTRSTGWPGLGFGSLRSVTSSDTLIVSVGAGANGPGDFDEAGNPTRAFAWISPPAPVP